MKPGRIMVVDDDESIRESLPDLLMSFGFSVRPFSSAEEFLDSGSADQADCLVLDVAMPGMSGPELQEELARLNYRIPIVFITAHADETIWERVLASGATSCLVKPFSETSIIDAVSTAMGPQQGY